MADHTIGGYDIIVDRDEPQARGNIAVLDVLDGTESVQQLFSLASQVRTISGYVFGHSNRTGISALIDGTAKTYTGNSGSGSFVIHSINWERVRGEPIGISGVSQSDPVWRATITMMASS